MATQTEGWILLNPDTGKAYRINTVGDLVPCSDRGWAAIATLFTKETRAQYLARKHGLSRQAVARKGKEMS